MASIAYLGPDTATIVARLVAALAPLKHADQPPRPIRTTGMKRPSTDQLMTVDTVMSRYQLRDPRAARFVMETAGGRKIGGRWQIRLERLLAWEDEPNRANELAAARAPSNHQHHHQQQPRPSTCRAFPPLASDWLADPEQETRR